MNDVKKTLSQWKEYLNDIFTEDIKLWLESLQRPIGTVTSFAFSTDIMDDGEKDGYKHCLPGPYVRIKLTFIDGTEKYGKFKYNGSKEIKDDEEENWESIWVRRKR
jgi:hypothetical protein